MSSNSSSRILAIALVVAVLVGSLGFAVGYVARPLLAREPAAAVTTSVVVVTSTASPEPPTATPTAPPTQTDAPTATPVPPSPTSSPTPTAAEDQAFDLFWETWNIVKQEFYGQLPSDEKVVEGAIEGALTTLDDPYTGYINPTAAAIQRQQDTGSYGGIGAYINMKDGQLVIVEPMKGSPAEAKGLRAGDVVLKVGDTPIQNVSIYEAQSLIMGEVGTDVRLTIGREGEPSFEVTITRGLIQVPVLEPKLRDDGLAYVALYDFSSDVSGKLSKAIQDLLAQKPKGLILDLRGNPGGWLTESVKVAGLFLPKDSLIVTERASDGSEQRWTSPDPPVAPDVPMVVLVDGASASASEIVSGALQDYKRATLVGETTFGKGAVQLAHSLSNGAELRVTVARWFTPNDRAIHGVGLTPDIVVPLTADDVTAGKDPQLDRAVQYLLEGK